METITRNPPAQEYFTNDRMEEYKEFRIVSTDPFGMWHAELPGKTLPKVLEGEWTSKFEIKKKIDWYVNTKRNEVEAKENKLPQDKNTRKVQEILRARDAE